MRQGLRFVELSQRAMVERLVTPPAPPRVELSELERLYAIRQLEQGR